MVSQLSSTSFPDDPDSAVTNYLLADTLFESKQYLDAAQEYENTAYHYGDHDKAAAAGYAAIVAYGKEEGRLVGRCQGGDAQPQTIDSSLKFAQTFPAAPGKRAGADAAPPPICMPPRIIYARDRRCRNAACAAAPGRPGRSSASPGP